MMLAIALLAQMPVDPTTGWTGPAALTAAGLLALVLFWLGAKHLPAKDSQILKLLEMASLDRDKDRSIRDRMSETITKVVADLIAQHRTDAEADRAAFMVRNSNVEEAIRMQTRELKDVLTSEIRSIMQQSCRYVSHPGIK